MSFVDFAEVKSRAPIEAVAQFLGLQLKPAGKQFRSACPACNQGGERAIVITPEKNLFYCFSAKIGGDCIALGSHIKGVSQKDSAALIAQQFGISGTVPSTVKSTVTVQSPPKKTAERHSFDPEAYAQRLEPANELLSPLNLSPETLTEWKSGYANHGTHRGRLALRLDDRHGKCVGYLGYALKGEQPKITAPNGVNVAEHIFGANRVKAGTLYLVRDPVQVLQAYESGVENVVCFLTDITPASLTILTSLMDTIGCDSVELF
ncbi:MAG: CHC2 zinc finger domain-containing protein [Pseudolabrys sp.]